MKLTYLILFFTINMLWSQENIKFTPFTNIGENTLDCFKKSNLTYHLSGIASTYLIVNTGIDYKVHNYFLKNKSFEAYSTPGVYMGYLMPLVLGGGLYGMGAINKSSREEAAGCAVLQASLLSVAYGSMLKLITGRPNPEPIEYNNNGGEFRFGFNRGGIHYGWPSGHMLTNTAVITSLMYFYKDNTALDILGITYLGYMFVSILSHENSTMHWFSDAAAGTLMGYAIGSTIGRNFRDRFENRTSNQSSKLSVIPNYCGVSVCLVF